jgi:hypothetical protein
VWSTARLSEEPDPSIEREMVILETVCHLLDWKHAQNHWKRWSATYQEEADGLKRFLASGEVRADPRSELWDAIITIHLLSQDPEGWLA